MQGVDARCTVRLGNDVGPKAATNDSPPDLLVPGQENLTSNSESNSSQSWIICLLEDTFADRRLSSCLAFSYGVAQVKLVEKHALQTLSSLAYFVRHAI